MTLIDGDRIITAQLYDDEYEEFTEKKMSIIDCINAYTDEGVTKADVVEQTRWIPVSERLPEDDGYYLVTFQRNLLTRTEQYLSISEFREGSWTEYGHIVAWCELPEPYKAESEDNA